MSTPPPPHSNPVAAHFMLYRLFSASSPDDSLCVALMPLVAATQGANFIFDNLISEALSQHEVDIDASLERSKEAMRVGGGKILTYVVQNGVSLAKRCMAEVNIYEYIYIYIYHDLWCDDEVSVRAIGFPTVVSLFAPLIILIAHPCFFWQSHNALLETVCRGAKQKDESDRFEEVVDEDDVKKAK